MTRFTVTCATCEGPIDFAEDGVSPRCAGCHQSGDGCSCPVSAELDWMSGALLAVQGSVERGRYRPRGVWVQQARKILTWLDEHGWQLIELGDRHVVEVRESGYGLQHPARCRPNLIDCPYNRWMHEQPVPPQPPGRYYMEISTHDFAASFERVAPSAVGGTDG